MIRVNRGLMLSEDEMKTNSIYSITDYALFLKCYLIRNSEKALVLCSPRKEVCISILMSDLNVTTYEEEYLMYMHKEHANYAESSRMYDMKVARKLLSRIDNNVFRSKADYYDWDDWEIEYNKKVLNNIKFILFYGVNDKCIEICQNILKCKNVEIDLKALELVKGRLKF